MSSTSMEMFLTRTLEEGKDDSRLDTTQLMGDASLDSETRNTLLSIRRPPALRRDTHGGELNACKPHCFEQKASDDISNGSETSSSHLGVGLTTAANVRPKKKRGELSSFFMKRMNKSYGLNSLLLEEARYGFRCQSIQSFELSEKRDKSDADKNHVDLVAARGSMLPLTEVTGRPILEWSKVFWVMRQFLSDGPPKPFIRSSGRLALRSPMTRIDTALELYLKNSTFQASETLENEEERFQTSPNTVLPRPIGRLNMLRLCWMETKKFQRNNKTFGQRETSGKEDQEVSGPSESVLDPSLSDPLLLELFEKGANVPPPPGFTKQDRNIRNILPSFMNKRSKSPDNSTSSTEQLGLVLSGTGQNLGQNGNAPEEIVHHLPIFPELDDGVKKEVRSQHCTRKGVTMSSSVLLGGFENAHKPASMDDRGAFPRPLRMTKQDNSFGFRGGAGSSCSSLDGWTPSGDKFRNGDKDATPPTQPSSTTSVQVSIDNLQCLGDEACEEGNERFRILDETEDDEGHDDDENENDDWSSMGTREMGDDEEDDDWML